MFYLISCWQKQAKKDLQSYFREEFRVELSAQVHTLVVLDEVGCKGCNVSLSNWIQKKALNHEKIWVLVTATGAHIDISPYLNVKYRNVFVEQNIGTFRELKLCGSSGIILLSQGRVEKVECLSAQELEKQFALLENRIK
ncbi:MAG: hypothetical protein NZ455_02220 [Bacteroidia bacterium]|nr:hypothetical protein [Bacteroidia bacterium]MDW8347687.1 hypothetical protein [Bacteroidia bacterium]